MRSTVIVVPCFNEAERLDLGTFSAYAAAHSDVSFLFVDDGSRDATGELLERAADADALSCLRLDANQGKGEAVRRGVLHALEGSPERVGYWDADLATPLEDIGRLGAMLDAHPEVLLAMGARVKLMGRSIRRSVGRHYVGRVFATFASWALGLPIYDTQCGAKLLRVVPATRTLWREPFLSRWIFDVELIARIAQLPGVDPGAAIREHPLDQWHDQPGSKLGLLDGLRAAADLVRVAWRYR